jgi:hypothetical protein
VRGFLDLLCVCSNVGDVQVKSGVWDANGVFIYTTLNHIKWVPGLSLVQQPMAFVASRSHLCVTRTPPCIMSHLVG